MVEETDIRIEEIKRILWGICDKHERMRCLLDLRLFLLPGMAMNLLGQVWQDVDNGEEYWPEVEDWIRSSPLNRQMLMDDEDWEAYKRILHKPITIYRGGGPEMRRSLDRCPAWTTDRKVADKFAYIESPLKPVVLQARVDPAEAYAYLIGRQEWELLLSPLQCPSFKLQKVIRLKPKSEAFAAYAQVHKAIHREGLLSSKGDYSLWQMLLSLDQLQSHERVHASRVELLRHYGLMKLAEKHEDLRKQVVIYINERIAMGETRAPIEVAQEQAAG